MNRGWTGLLAWSVLALVIAVPSTEILMTRNDGADASKVFVGPPVADAAGENDADAAVLPFQPETAPVRVVLSTESKALPLPPIVPAGAPNKPVADEVLVPKETSVVPALETAALDAGEPKAPTTTHPEYVGAESLIVPNAPTPMPVLARPRQTAVINQPSAPQTQLQRDVSQSIATVRTTVRDAPALRGEVFEPDHSRFWGDDPRYRGRENLQAFESDDASDSSFYELWKSENRPAGFQRRGSFEEQLPARRGSAVRLDLLQR